MPLCLKLENFLWLLDLVSLCSLKCLDIPLLAICVISLRLTNCLTHCYGITYVLPIMKTGLQRLIREKQDSRENDDAEVLPAKHKMSVNSTTFLTGNFVWPSSTFITESPGYFTWWLFQFVFQSSLTGNKVSVMVVYFMLFLVMSISKRRSVWHNFSNPTPNGGKLIFLTDLASKLSCYQDRKCLRHDSLLVSQSC